MGMHVATRVKTVRYYEGPFYALSNFSAHAVVYRGEHYMTAEPGGIGQNVIGKIWMELRKKKQTTRV